MVVRLELIVLFVEQTLQCCLLLRVALQEKEHSPKRLSVGYGTLVERQTGKRMNVPHQRHMLFFIHSLREPRWEIRTLGLRRQRGESRETD